MAAVDTPGADMSDVRSRYAAWRNSLVRSRKFQSWAARFPLTRRMVRRDGERLFDLVAGFTYSQVLQAVVALDLLDHLETGPRSARDLALRCDVPFDRMAILCQGAAGIGLLTRNHNGDYGLARLGAAIPGVPGLREMILHHQVLYRDLSDPVACFRGETETELADFWPYVFGAEGEVDPKVAATYSALMADSQVLVAEETLKAVDLSGSRRLLDIGGGTGAFLAAVGIAYPDLELELFDLPVVAPGAADRFAEHGQTDRAIITTGSFRTDPLPQGADVISLIRVLYDHRDVTVMELLAKAFAALPPGGRIVISEPMSGGHTPERAGDAYFALYCMAMRTGTVRSENQVAGLLTQAGFVAIQTPAAHRPFVTRVVTAQKSQTT